MRNLFLILIFSLSAVACSNGDGPKRELYPFNGTWTFTGRFCDSVESSYRCVPSVQPASCAGTVLPVGFVIDFYGENILINGANSPMSHAGSQITVVNSGQNFSVKQSLDTNTMVYVFAPNCEMEFRRQ